MLPESAEEQEDGTNDSHIHPPSTPDSNTGDHSHPGGSGSGIMPEDKSSLPATPYSAAGSKKSRIAFLKSLSEDQHYRQLIRLLHAAKVCQSSIVE